MWGKRKTKEQQALEERVALAVISDPRWQVRVLDSDWFCPFCGQVGVRSRPDHPIVDPILRHLNTACDAFAASRGGTMLPLEELRRRAHRLLVAGRLEQDEAWQAWDEAGNWYCPYCGEAAVLADASVGPLAAETVTRIDEHVVGCAGYRGGAGEAIGAADLHQRVLQAATIRRVQAKVLEMVNAHSLWRVADPDGAWVCPYCVLAIPGIDASAPVDRERLAGAIARHLVRTCHGYRSKRAPVRETQELRSLALGETPVAGGEDETVESIPKLGTITQQMRLSEEELARSRARDMEKDLAYAQKAQRGMLPGLPSFPGFQIEVLYRPCGHLAGDFYDFVQIDEDRLGFVIGDVSGHGVDAALVMGMVKKVLNLAGRMHPDPARALAMTNEEIYRDLARGMFVTAWYGVFDRRDRVLRCARAGHEPVYLFNPARRPRILEYRPPGIALGLDPGPRFASTLKPEEVRLCEGDHLLLFTDGIAESKSPEGEEFGFARIQAVMAKYGAAEPRTLIGKLDRISANFRKGGLATDDLTLVAIKVAGGG